MSGASEAALRTLAKLDQVLPPRLRSEVRTLQDATSTLAGGGVEVDGAVLMTLARACREAVRVRFGYADRDDVASERTVEPVQLVATGRRWYLMAWDTDRDDWRTFRLDRMREVAPTTWRFRPREHPDPAAYVQESVVASPYRYVAKVRVHAPAADVRRQVPPGVGSVEPDSPGWSLLTVGGDDLDWMAAHLAMLRHDLEILDPPELLGAAARLSATLASIARPAG